MLGRMKYVKNFSSLLPYLDIFGRGAMGRWSPAAVNPRVSQASCLTCAHTSCKEVNNAAKRKSRGLLQPV